jgi:hypothetical protein
LLSDNWLREAEVAEHDVEVFVEKHVLRFYIFVAVTSRVQVLKATNELFEDIESDSLAELAEFEDVIADAAVGSKVEN